MHLATASCFWTTRRFIDDSTQTVIYCVASRQRLRYEDVQLLLSFWLVLLTTTVWETCATIECLPHPYFHGTEPPISGMLSLESDPDPSFTADTGRLVMIHATLRCTHPLKPHSTVPLTSFSLHPRSHHDTPIQNYDNVVCLDKLLLCTTKLQELDTTMETMVE
jgi:hypothetical protein